MNILFLLNVQNSRVKTGDKDFLAFEAMVLR